MATSGSPLKNSEVRAVVLKAYYDQEMRGQQAAIDPDEVAKRIGVPRRQVEVALKYLVDMGLLNGTYVLGTDVPLTWGITALGLDVVDNPKRFQSTYEINQQNIHVSGDVYGQIAQAQQQSQVVQTANTLADLESLIDQNTNIPETDRDTLKANVREIETELGKDQPSKSKIGALIQSLRKYDWLYPKVVDFVKKTLDKNFLAA